MNPNVTKWQVTEPNNRSSDNHSWKTVKNNQHYELFMPQCMMGTPVLEKLSRFYLILYR